MYWINRTACDVLEEMRKLTKNLNVNSLDRYADTMPYLIEEAQSMYNKMEAGLGDQKNLRELAERCSDMKKEHKELKLEVSKLKAESKKLKGEEDTDEEKIEKILGSELLLDEWED